MINKEIVKTGFVLKNVVYGESDGIVTILTEDGLVTFKARGINKLTSKNKASCLLYSKSEFTLEESKKNYLVLTKGKLISSNYELYSSLDYMVCLGVVSESITSFLDSNTSKEIYNLFQAMTECLTNHFDIFTITAIFLAKITIEAGYGLDISRCVRCSNRDKIVFMSYNDGGFVCKRCLNPHEEVQSSEYLKSIRYTFMVTEDNYFHYELKREISLKLIREYIRYLQEAFGFKKLNFFELFDQTY